MCFFPIQNGTICLNFFKWLANFCWYWIIIFKSGNTRVVGHHKLSAASLCLEILFAFSCIFRFFLYLQKWWNILTIFLNTILKTWNIRKIHQNCSQAFLCHIFTIWAKEELSLLPVAVITKYLKVLFWIHVKMARKLPGFDNKVTFTLEQFLKSQISWVLNVFSAFWCFYICHGIHFSNVERLLTQL